MSTEALLLVVGGERVWGELLATARHRVRVVLAAGREAARGQFRPRARPADRERIVEAT